jgi:hypothetical protein
VREHGGRAAVGGHDLHARRASRARQSGDRLGTASGVFPMRGISPDAGDADQRLQVGAGVGHGVVNGSTQLGHDERV